MLLDDAGLENQSGNRHPPGVDQKPRFPETPSISAKPSLVGRRTFRLGTAQIMFRRRSQTWRAHEPFCLFRMCALLDRAGSRCIETGVETNWLAVFAASRHCLGQRHREGFHPCNARGNGCISRPGLKLRKRSIVRRRSLHAVTSRTCYVHTVAPVAVGPVRGKALHPGARCLLTRLVLNPVVSKYHCSNAVGEATP